MPGKWNLVLQGRFQLSDWHTILLQKNNYYLVKFHFKGFDAFRQTLK